MKIAVFPGSFDPITKGHEDVINRALPLFDKIIIAIGLHHEKNGFFSIEERKKLPAPKKPISQLSRKPWMIEENGNNNGNETEIDTGEGNELEAIPENNLTLPGKKKQGKADPPKKSKKKSKSKANDEE